MQFTVLINQSRALEWGLNAQQAMLFAFLYGCPAWAETCNVDGDLYFRLSKAKICNELPLLTDKPNTVHKLLKTLEALGLILMEVFDNETHFSITEKGALWNTSEGVEKNPGGGKKSIPGVEKNPRRGGKKSTVGVEKNPTNQIISNQITISNNHDHKKYKKINLDGLSSEISERCACEFIDHRERLKKPLTQGAFDRAMCEALMARSIGVSPDRAISECVDAGWVGIKIAWLKNRLFGGQGGAPPGASALLGGIRNTRDVPLVENLSDRSWAE